MKKSVTISLVLFSVLLNIILLIIFYNNYQYTKSTTPFEIKTLWENTNSWKYIIDNISNEIKNDSSFKTCMTNNTNYCLNQYINNSAVENSDYKLCEKLSDPNIALSCKEIVILNLSGKNNDIKICEELWDKKSYCISQILTKKALETLDIKICDDIEDEKASNTWTISNWNYEITCKNNVAMQLATSKKDKSYCSKIEDTNMQEICKNTVEMTK